MLQFFNQKNKKILITFIYLFLIKWSTLCNALKILQIVPGFTNSHVLFNYRLGETLTKLGHQVHLWTQMEMNIVVGDVRLPDNLTETRVPIYFTDKLKTEGLKVLIY